ncbi:MAG: UDP-N-acetylmuramate dehydrogenase [Clostridia bacterium]|nr:UDP-N-acetylmuramate dehydrogenase [Clostridia bacterium]
MFERFEVLQNADMRQYTTLKLGGTADWLAFPRSAAEIAELFAEAGAAGLPVTVIGHGSNVLVLDGGIRGLVIRIDKNMKNIRREGNRLTAAAGAMLGAVAGFAAENGLTGLEFASGIPGTVGGAVTMNAGAYGGEMKDVVVRVDGILPDGTEMSLSGEEMRFGYRRSAVKDLNLIVTEVTMELAEGDPAEIRAKMSELNRQRAEKQPLDVPSAGSTFKRPEGFYAAALIDQCGLKGYSVGGAQVSMKHAGFLVNSGDSSRDYLELVRTVQRIVRERAGVELEPEIRIIGEEV